MNNELTIRQSNIGNFLNCPKAFELGMTHGIPQTSAMKDGLLFETYLFGSKNPTVATDESINLILNRKVKKDGNFYALPPVTLEKLHRIKTFAEIIKEKYFPNFDGLKRFVTFRYVEDDVLYKGEADAIGDIRYDPQEDKILNDVIIDIKFTGDIWRVWGGKDRKEQFLQAVMYNWLGIKTKLLTDLKPFVYLIVENNTFAEPIAKTIKINVTEQALEWLETIFENIKTAHEFEFAPIIDNRCYECKMLQYCGFGRRFIEIPIEFNFEDLITEFND